MNKCLFIALFIMPPMLPMDQKESASPKKSITNPNSRRTSPPKYTSDLAQFIAAEYSHERLVNIVNQAFDQSDKISSMLRNRIAGSMTKPTLRRSMTWSEGLEGAAREEREMRCEKEVSPHDSEEQTEDEIEYFV